MKKELKLNEGSLPDELWIKILEVGIENSILGCGDICAFSISCKHFNKLSNDDILWSSLITLDFPPKSPNNHHHQSSSISISSKKTLYKYKLDRYIRNKYASIKKRLIKHERSLGRLAIRIQRLRRGMMEMIEQLQEFSGDSLDYIKERYSLCLEELEDVERSHMNMEEAAAYMHAEISATEAELNSSSVDGEDTNILEADETGSSEDTEDSTEDESDDSSDDGSEDNWEGDSEEGSDVYDDEEF
ncbi:hypothetical protein AQUCO_00200867v1 [Aquilegia coerulea]|uniref:F-box domain-containing protein n=1 Tax=Aquilegia coerulea TaxID=218851 RepID=A0A2G5F581_AQUCA|nr:hypothetical protein AQUCO_00200867v1 [Aquilegia coerulea]